MARWSDWSDRDSAYDPNPVYLAPPQTPPGSPDQPVYRPLPPFARPGTWRPEQSGATPPAVFAPAPIARGPWYGSVPVPVAPPAHWYGPPPPDRGRPSERKSRRRLLVPGLVAVVAVIGIVLTVVLVGSSSSGAPYEAITPPASAAGYTELSASAGGSLAGLLPAVFGGALGVGSAELTAYSLDSSGEPDLVLATASAEDSSELRSQLASVGYSGEAERLLQSTGVDQPVTEPGLSGGSLQCGSIEELVNSFTACAWADHNGVALVLVLSDQSTDELAATTLAFRSAAEH